MKGTRTGSIKFYSLLAAFAAILLALAGAANAQTPLTSVLGSPFNFSEAGYNSNVVRLSPDETHLFVSNQDSGTVTVLNVAANGSLSFQGVYPAYSYAPNGWMLVNGMATNPVGDRLYVVGIDWSGYGAVSVHSVAADGTLTWLQDQQLSYPSFVMNGIVYVPQASGDTIYVNDNAYQNTVSALAVAADGTLSPRSGSPYLTGGIGGTTYFASTDLRAAGGRLFAINRQSRNISVFNIGTDGGLALVSGSPFTVPSSFANANAIAVDPAGAYLYAGEYYNGRIARFAVGADGALGSPGVFPMSLNYRDIDDLVISPNGAYIVATTGYNNYMEVMDTASMRPLFGSPQPHSGDFSAGVVMNAAGTRVFVGNASGGRSQVSVYDFSPTAPIPPLTLTPRVDPTAPLDKFGAATLTGTLSANFPQTYSMLVVLRQKQAHAIVTIGTYLYIAIGQANGTTPWTLKASSTTQALKGGAAEVTLTANGYDPVTGESKTATVVQTVQLKGK